MIYDLKTAMKWKSLKGHKHSISSIASEPSGSYLASFSAKDKNLIIWKVKNLFNGRLDLEDFLKIW